jgi:hypothetical protein
MPVLFATILVSLDNIQEHLENLFYKIGEDDIAINAEKFVEQRYSQETLSPPEGRGFKERSKQPRAKSTGH